MQFTAKAAVRWGRTHGRLAALPGARGTAETAPAPQPRSEDPIVRLCFAPPVRFARWPVLCVLAGVAAGLAACHKADEAANADRTMPTVSTVVPHRTALDNRLEFTGTISARYELPIGVEGEGGRIAQVLVDAGDRVRQGQVLARLDPAVVRAQVASLAASVEEARATAELAAADYRRAEAVAPAGALSKEEVERRRSVAATAAAKVKVAAAQLAEAEGRLARLDVKAPSDGLVLTRRAEIGQSATPGGEPLFRLAKNGDVELRGLVAEQDVPHLKVGQSVTVHVTGVDRPFEGRIWQIGAVIDPQSRLGSVRVALKPEADLRPGAFARASLSVDHDAQIVIPQTAVLSDTDGSYVYVLDEQNKVLRRPVRIQGTSSAGVIVASGLTGEEHVITLAGAFLHEGETVKRAPEPESTKAESSTKAEAAAAGTRS